MATIAASVSKTHRAVIAHEAVLNGGVGAEIAARIGAELFDELDAPVLRVGCAFAPIPFAPELERALLPGSADIVRAVREGIASVTLVAQEIPKVGLVMEEVKVVRWLKNVGDSVIAGEPLLEVETEKSVVEIEAAATGRLTRSWCRSTAKRLSAIRLPGSSLPQAQSAAATTPARRARDPKDAPTPSMAATAHARR